MHLLVVLVEKIVFMSPVQAGRDIGMTYVICLSDCLSSHLSLTIFCPLSACHILCQSVLAGNTCLRNTRVVMMLEHIGTGCSFSECSFAP